MIFEVMGHMKSANCGCWGPSLKTWSRSHVIFTTMAIFLLISESAITGQTEAICVINPRSFKSKIRNTSRMQSLKNFGNLLTCMLAIGPDLAKKPHQTQRNCTREPWHQASACRGHVSSFWMLLTDTHPTTKVKLNMVKPGCCSLLVFF